MPFSLVLAVVDEWVCKRAGQGMVLLFSSVKPPPYPRTFNCESDVEKALSFVWACL